MDLLALKKLCLFCNPYFIELGIKTGHINIINTARKFGFDNFTGVNEHGVDESSDYLPDTKHFSYGDIANISIGQGDMHLQLPPGS